MSQEYQAKKERMMSYLTKGLRSPIKLWKLVDNSIFRMRNMEANSLVKPAFVPISKLNKTPIEYLEGLNIHDKELLPMATRRDDGWQAQIIQYL